MSVEFYYPPFFSASFRFIDTSPLTDSTIAPPKPAIIIDERFKVCRNRNGFHEKPFLTHFHVCKGLSKDDVGAARGTVFQEIRPEAGFKTGDFVKQKLRGLS